MTDFSYVTTKDLVDELQTRLETAVIVARTKENDGSFVYHRRIWGEGTWGLYLPLKCVLEEIQRNYENAEEHTWETDFGG